jgi:hypothetical protein
MKTSSVLTIISLAIMPFIAWPILQPYWEDYQQVVQDCAQTKPEHRNKKQEENCKPRGAVGLIIPGIL